MIVIKLFLCNTKKATNMLVNIQIKPTFAIYFRRYNSMNFEQRMTFELARLETYKSAPTSFRAWRIRLAKEGLYYIDDSYTCKCAFCEFYYRLSWTNGDNPDEIHRRSDTCCPFLLDRVNTNNIPMHADERTLFRSPAFRTSSSGNYQHPAVFAHGHVSVCQTDRRPFVEELMEGANSLMRQIFQNMPQTGNESNPNLCTIFSERWDNEQRAGQSAYANCTTQDKSAVPKHPEYAVSSARIDSFKKWPKHRTHSPVDMAAAGFFYTGKEDICRCFYCGGGLQQWEPNDKPWTEHARWYTNCAFVRQFKGNELIAEHRHINLPNADETYQNVGLTDSVTKDCDFKSLPAVRAVIEMGYDLCFIKRAYDFLQKKAKTVRDIKNYFHAQINEELFLCEENRVLITRYIAIKMFDDGTEISCIRLPDSNETTAKKTITHETN